MPPNLLELSAIQGRPFDQHAWSLRGGVAIETTSRPELSREQSQTFCRTVSDKAFAHLAHADGTNAFIPIWYGCRPACGPSRRQCFE